MATILFTDRGGVTPADLDAGPLGGAESAFVELAQATAARGHRVSVRNRCPERPEPERSGGIDWAPLDRPTEGSIDLHVANRDPTLLVEHPAGRRRALWLHNTARYLLHPKKLLPMLRVRPAMVFSGPYHRSTYPRWAPSGPALLIPYGISRRFREAEPAATPPPPRAIFTSNPLRSLDWLVELWVREIHPAVPTAELHVFSGPSTYGDWGAKVAPRMRPALDAARAARDAGVVLREPVAREELARELAASRVLLYRGDVEETFCLAVAEAQAVGVPCVLQDLGSVGERIRHRQTGFVAANDDEFARRAIELLTDDPLWSDQHRAALATQRSWGWDEAAAAFEALLADGRR